MEVSKLRIGETVTVEIKTDFDQNQLVIESLSFITNRPYSVLYLFLKIESEKQFLPETLVQKS